MIIDGRSYNNVASTNLVENLNLTSLNILSHLNYDDRMIVEKLK